MLIGLIVSIVSGFYLGKDYERRQRYTTIDECVALSREVRINESTKKCFDNLSFDEFGFLADPKNKDAMDLFNEVGAYYDTRTDAQKKADAEAMKQFWDKAP